MVNGKQYGQEGFAETLKWPLRSCHLWDAGWRWAFWGRNEDQESCEGCSNYCGEHLSWEAPSRARVPIHHASNRWNDRVHGVNLSHSLWDVCRAVTYFSDVIWTLLTSWWCLSSETVRGLKVLVREGKWHQWK